MLSNAVAKKQAGKEDVSAQVERMRATIAMSLKKQVDDEVNRISG